jgi:hypothetical protein
MKLEHGRQTVEILSAGDIPVNGDPRRLKKA